jgi:hypothetical protein
MHTGSFPLLLISFFAEAMANEVISFVFGESPRGESRARIEK